MAENYSQTYTQNKIAHTLNELKQYTKQQIKFKIP